MVIHKAKAMRGDLAAGARPAGRAGQGVARARDRVWVGCAARRHPNQRQSHRPPPAAPHTHAVPARG
eukprot:1149740-Prymnesium_polylepis.1